MQRGAGLGVGPDVGEPRALIERNIPYNPRDDPYAQRYNDVDTDEEEEREDPEWPSDVLYRKTRFPVRWDHCGGQVSEVRV